MANVYYNTAYGESQPLLNVFAAPIISLRAPTTADKAQIGTLWVYTTTNTAYVLTSIVGGLANWTVGGNSGAGDFTSVVVNPGNLTVTAGNISATAGSISAGTTVTAGTGITATTGNIVATTGTITALANIVSGAGIIITSDPTPQVGTVGISDATSTILSTGTLSIKATTTNNGNNTGFLKIYIGTTTAWIPYFDVIAP